MKKHKTPLEIAINAVGGKQKILAEKVGLTPQAISQLKKRGGKLSKTRIRKFREATNLPLETLYPEMFK